MKKIIKYSLGTLMIILTVSLSTIAYFQHTKSTQVLEGNGDCVILLHGLGRLSSSMESMAEYLNESGLKTVNIDYPSTKYDIETLSKLYLQPAVTKYCDSSDEINFVTHSLGGIIARYYLENNKLENLKKVVMLAPPNQGSKLADYLKKIKIITWIMGPAMSQLGTDTESVPLNLPEPNYDVYVIAGKKSNNKYFSKIITGDDDGKVAIEETKLKNMEDFLLVPESHTHIMDKEEVKTAVKKFLEE